MATEGRLAATVGAVLRGRVRRTCLMMGLEYQEEKGWLESAFVIRGPVTNWSV